MIDAYQLAARQRALRRVSVPAAPLPSMPPPPRPPGPGTTAAPFPSADTLADAITFIEGCCGWDKPCKSLLKTCVSGVGRAVALSRARSSGYPIDLKHIDLAGIPFDLPAINRNLEGQTYRQAGFNTAKSLTNAKWGFRRVCREMGKIASERKPDLPPDSPYVPLVDAATAFSRATMVRFASECYRRGVPPELVEDALVVEYGGKLLADMVGVKVTATLRMIVRLWNKVARRIPGWRRLALPASKRPPASPPLSAYSAAVQEEAAAVRRWMEGGVVPGMAGCGPTRTFGHGRRPARRPTTVECRMKYIGLTLGVHVGPGHDPQAVTSLRRLLAPEAFRAILQALWERGQARRLTVPEAERDHDESGLTRQMDMAAQTLMMLANHCFPQPPEVLRELRELARKARKATPGEMTQKNQRRLRQFEDPVKLGLLLNLAHDLVAEAMNLRHTQPAEATRRARAAAIFAIECRIPLRIQNLASCRIGYNLRLCGAASERATLGFQAHETKNKLAVEYAVGPRPLKLLQAYVTHFLPFSAQGSPDFADKRWLFPADRGRPGHLSISQVRDIICRTMAERVGVVFHPHLFRALAVSLSLEHAPGSLEHACQLLGDKTMEVVTRHYAAVRRKEAARHQDKIIEAEARRLAAPLRRHARAAPLPLAARRRGGLAQGLQPSGRAIRPRSAAQPLHLRETPQRMERLPVAPRHAGTPRSGRQPRGPGQTRVAVGLLRRARPGRQRRHHHCRPFPGGAERPAADGARGRLRLCNAARRRSHPQDAGDEAPRPVRPRLPARRAVGRALVLRGARPGVPFAAASPGA